MIAIEIPSAIPITIRAAGNTFKIHYLYIYLYNIKYYAMITATISDFRKDIKQYLTRVTENFETLIINRGKSSGVVVISLEEYNSLITTQHEMSSDKNKARLDSAIEKFKEGKSFGKGLIE